MKSNPSSNKNLAEDQLIQRLMNRDKQALSYLYDKYGDALYGIAFRIVGNEDVTKEVVQDVFLKIWNKIALYNASKGRFFTWMLNLTRNEAIDKVRSKEIRKSSKTNSIDNYVYKDPDMNTQSQVESIGVRELMNDLDEDQQFVLKRVYFEGFSHSEVSKEFNIPLGTVKTRLRTALKNLRKKNNI